MPPKPSAPQILRNATGTSAELWFYTEFGSDWCGYISADLVRQTLANLDPGTKLIIHINSEGGDVVHAQAIYNMLKNYGSKITVEIDGWCLSCASWVAQAGDVRIMAENAQMMVHDPEGVCDGCAEEMRATADLLDRVKMSIAGVYAARSGQPVDVFSAAMTKETWYTAEEALAAGLIDSISPNKGVMNRANVSRFKNAPDWLRPLAPQSEGWKRAMNERRLLLNEAASV